MVKPTGKDFTYYSAPYDKYTRIDYTFITQKDLPALHDARIGIQTYSDHTSILLTPNPPEAHTKPYMCRMNPFILTDPDSIQKTNRTLRNYFSENYTEKRSPLTIWRTHKCVLREELMKLGAQRK